MPCALQVSHALLLQDSLLLALVAAAFALRAAEETTATPAFASCIELLASRLRNSFGEGVVVFQVALAKVQHCGTA